jgi:hypothetical protein
MSSLVFVHGIGVRALPEGGEHPYKATCRAIQNELFYKQIDWTLVECPWGDKLGAKLAGGGKSFPTPPGALAIEAQPRDPAALWDYLIQDPSFELRSLSEILKQIPGVAGGAPGQAPQWLVLQQRLAAGITPSGQLEDLKKYGLEAAFAAAMKETQTDPAANSAVRHPQAARALARSVIARTVRIGLDEGIPPPGLTDLEVLAIATEQQFQQAALAAPLDWAKSVMVGWGLRVGTRIGTRKRATLAESATPIAGDVILYQVHGDRIRNRIREIVAHAPEPVAILAHSLGGIASLEALLEDPAMRGRVKKFITAGSQSGFFYEIDALRTLPFGQGLPDDFPDWLNFFDQRDFLSFLTKDVFTGGRSRTDVEVKSGLPFPASHSGYWRQQTTWERLKLFLADQGDERFGSACGGHSPLP